MRVFSLAIAAIIALFAGLNTSAHAGWKGGIFGIPSSPAAAIPKGNYKKSTVRRKTRSQVATTKRRNSSVKVAQKSRSRKSGSRRRGGSLRGLASFYWQPQRVASGGWFNPNALTAAHRSLPFGTRVRVTNLRNGRSVVVRINDRGPYIRGRIIDLSKRAAGVVGMRSAGVVPVRVDVL